MPPTRREVNDIGIVFTTTHIVHTGAYPGEQATLRHFTTLLETRTLETAAIALIEVRLADTNSPGANPF